MWQRCAGHLSRASWSSSKKNIARGSYAVTFNTRAPVRTAPCRTAPTMKRRGARARTTSFSTLRRRSGESGEQRERKRPPPSPQRFVSVVYSSAFSRWKEERPQPPPRLELPPREGRNMPTHPSPFLISAHTPALTDSRFTLALLPRAPHPLRVHPPSDLSLRARRG